MEFHVPPKMDMRTYGWQADLLPSKQDVAGSNPVPRSSLRDLALASLIQQIALSTPRVLPAFLPI